MANFEKIIDLLAIEEIINRLSDLEKEEMIRKLKDLRNIVYPFSDYEFIISNLLWLSKMSLIEYENMRDEYSQRNRHLDKFQMAWKSVGKWAEDIMIDGWYGLKKPSKKIDPSYSQQTSYDAYMDYEWNTIRVEIKASRVTESWNDTDFFIDKALFSNTTKEFWMNFQQLKPQYCDVFVFIAIYRDKLTHWILSSNEVKNYWTWQWQNWKFSPWQHSWNAWNEGQLHIRDINIHDFDRFISTPEKIQDDIKKAYQRQKKIEKLP